MKILAIGDTADNMITYQKFSKNHKISLINFPKKGVSKYTEIEDGIEYFDSLILSKQINRIKKIKDDFDLTIVIGWPAARIAYFSGVNYLMYFVGNDITTPPFEKNVKPEYLKKSFIKRNFFERKLDKKIFDNAIGHMTSTIEYSEILKKYDQNAIRLDKVIVDNDLFNNKIKPVNLKKEKFTFFSPQRMGLEKGFDIIWEALKHCKTDFEILQVEWFDERTAEEEEFKQFLIKNKPKQVKFIPLIKREQITTYYNYADAILGQMRVGIHGGIEREASFCRKPVICYTDLKKPLLINGEEILPPFLPNSKEPIKLAELIDLLVESEKFRNELAEKQYNFIVLTSEPSNVIYEWEKIFNEFKIKFPTNNRKQNVLNKIIENYLLKIFEKYYLKKFKNKNLDSFGKTEYERLFRK